MTGETERWHLATARHVHEVEVSRKPWATRVLWRVDGVVVAATSTSDEDVSLSPGAFEDLSAHLAGQTRGRGVADEDAAEPEDESSATSEPWQPAVWEDAWDRVSDTWSAEDVAALGAISVKLPALLGPTRRVALHDGIGRAVVGVGGDDLTPEPGSAPARRLEWIAAHPRLHALRAGLGKGGGMAATALVTLVFVQWVLPWVEELLRWLRGLVPDFTLPTIPWPDIPWPSIPWPDLPEFELEIDLPDINLPFPDVSVPGWMEPVLRYGIPILIAVLIALLEARRQQRKERRATASANDVTQSLEADEPDLGSDPPHRA